VALFLVTQKMAMPPAETEQAAMQQKMMKWMTVFMGLLFYKVASGLCLYFIASSLWGIAERKLLPKAKSLPGAADAKPSASAPQAVSGMANATDGSNGSRRGRRPKAKRKK
jgi:YidC/Oxa1 family membrane protein insertase